MSPDRPLRRYVFPALAAALVLFAAGCGYYVTVQRGDTLSEIAERYDVTVNDLLEANPGIDNPNRILEGQKVRIPRDKSIAAQEKPARERNVRETPRPRSTPRPTPPPRGTPAPEPTPTAIVPAPTPPGPIGEPDEMRPSFIWPVRGPIVRRFGKGPDGVLTEGIDIAGAAGQSVVAAADGQVIVADDRLKGYGKMIVIQHANKYVTIYAHNRVNYVQKGQKVAQGERIAEVGDSGRAERPLLHFEIRKGIKALDPLKLLPRS